MLLLCVLVVASSAQDHLDLVNIFIGTGGAGFHVGSMGPHAQVPFGNVRVGPDTTEDLVYEPWNHAGGYHYEDPWIRSFSHCHLVGAGVTDLGLVAVMPVDKAPTAHLVHDYGFKSRFSHAAEWASPGYYGVELDSHKVLAEMTATAFTAVHRATFMDTQRNFLYMYMSHSTTPKSAKNAAIAIDASKQEVSGFVLDNGSLSSRFGGALVYYAIKFSEPFASYGTWVNKTVNEGSSSVEGLGVGAFVEFAKAGSNTTVHYCVTLSWQSVEQARANMAAEVSECHSDISSAFEVVQKAARAQWTQKLNTMFVSGGSHDDQVMFYSNLYQSFLTPTRYTEANGKYIGFDKQVHNTPSDMKFYMSDMSIWDEFRSKMPLLAIIDPATYLDVIRSLVIMIKEGGDLARWPLVDGYTGCMIGSHANQMIVDAYIKGLTDFDVETAYEGMKNLSTVKTKHNGRDDLPDWISKGYVPSDKSSHSVSRTLAYSFDDAAVSHLATLLGKTEDAALFHNRSHNYKTLWNDKEQLFCGKTSAGAWDCPVDKGAWGKLFTEASAWQWRWFVPHDLPGLVSLFKSVDYCVEQLDVLFEKGALIPYDVAPNPYYWAGNEPALLIPWIYPFANKPSKTQYWTRWLIDHRYSVKADGLPGNNDYGTMSAWLVFADLGFYPLTGTTTYVVGSPLFDEVRVPIPSMNTSVRVVTHGVSKENIYIARAALNGKPVTAAFVDHNDLVVKDGKEAVLEFWMTGQPTTWGER